MKKYLYTPLLLAACRVIPQSVDPVIPENHTFVNPPIVVRPEAGIIREKVVIPSEIASPNPVTQSETPSSNNVAIYFRYREDTPTPKPARAIIVAMPGFLGGGPSFDALARSLVIQGIAFDANPQEFTPLQALAESMTFGGGNFYEWYFPARLALDIAAVGGARVSVGSYQEQFGLRATDGADIGVPILAVAASLVGPAAYEALRARVSPTVSVGPNSGATRDEEAGFSVLDLSTTFGHLDPVTAPDSPQNPIPTRVFQFVLDNIEAGTILIP